MMRGRLVLLVGCVVGAVWWCGSVLHANPLKDPKRVVSGQTVDLDPLFQWWAHRQGERPLYAWAHLTGHIVSTNSWGWTVDAQLDRPPAEAKSSAKATVSAGGRIKVALRHPPTAELDDFSLLAATYAAWSNQAQALSNQVQAAGARLRAIGPNYQRSAAVAVETRQLHLNENQAKAQLANLRPLLADAHARLATFPEPNQYVVDCFALDTKERFNGLPAYDYGRSLSPYRPATAAPAKK